MAYGYNANGDLVSDGLRSYTYDAEGRLAAATTGATDVSPTTRYAHNALGQRVFKTEPLYPPGPGDEADPGFMQMLIAFFKRLWSPAVIFRRNGATCFRHIGAGSNEVEGHHRRSQA